MYLGFDHDQTGTWNLLDGEHCLLVLNQTFVAAREATGLLPVVPVVHTRVFFVSIATDDHAGVGLVRPFEENIAGWDCRDRILVNLHITLAICDWAEFYLVGACRVAVVLPIPLRVETGTI